MKRSLTLKLFVSVVLILLILLVFQTYTLRSSFNSLYLKSMLSNYKNELLESTLGFSGGNERSSNQNLKKYTAETGSPILVFNENYEFADREFFNHFSNLSANAANSGIVKILFDSVSTQQSIPYLNRGLSVGIKSVPLGNSSYSEPLIVTLDKEVYVNKEGLRKYNDEIYEPRDFEGHITQVKYTSPKDIKKEIAFFMIHLSN